MKLDYFIGEDIKKSYFDSALVETLPNSADGISSQDGRLKVYLPPKLGFCHGVVRSVRMSMYATEKYKGQNIYLLNEMIHNPFVNRELRRRGIQFLHGRYSDGEPGLDMVTADDIVLVPAFGGTPAVYQQLTDIGCTVVDTTCGEVASVWKRIEKKYNIVDFTSIVFGKAHHEETIATSARAKCYFIVKDLAETQRVAAYIKHPTAEEAQALLDDFQGAYSPHFDPSRDFQRVGMASQTTMYANQFITASAIIREALEERYGEAEIDDHFLALDTICSATQERQDAIQFLLPDVVDVMFIVGGYNSSNTMNLTRIASEHVPAYHIEGSDKISERSILHQPLGSKEEIETWDWFPQNKDNSPPQSIKIGLTSGASTPDSILESVIHEILALGGGPNQSEAISW